MLGKRGEAGLRREGEGAAIGRRRGTWARRDRNEWGRFVMMQTKVDGIEERRVGGAEN
jgi:hypothetical protein